MSSLFFFFFFVCLSMHACKARHLGVVMDDNNVSSKKHLFSTKVVESVKQLNKEEPIKISVRSGDCIIFHESDDVKPKDSDKQKREMSAAASVSGKDLDERSGFFSDYSTPRIRPPSHN